MKNIIPDFGTFAPWAVAYRNPSIYVYYAMDLTWEFDGIHVSTLTRGHLFVVQMA